MKKKTQYSGDGGVFAKRKQWIKTKDRGEVKRLKEPEVKTPSIGDPRKTRTRLASREEGLKGRLKIGKNKNGVEK